MVDTTPENPNSNVAPPSGEAQTPPEAPVFNPLKSLLSSDQYHSLPDEAKSIVDAEADIISATGDPTAIDYEKKLNALADIETTPEFDDTKQMLMAGAYSSQQFASNAQQEKQLQEQLDVQRVLEKERDKQDVKFRTFLSQYLSPEEKENIVNLGPDYWEQLYSNVMFLLTADPSSDVLRDQSLTSKVSALQEYIGNNGAEWFVKSGVEPNKAAQMAQSIVADMIIDTNDSILAHNLLRAGIMSVEIDNIAKVFQSVPPELYDKLSGRSMAENSLKQRITTDANRVYEQAAVARVVEKYRRHQYLQQKKDQQGTLTESEHVELENGYLLEHGDLLPKASLVDAVRVKHHKHHVWTRVYEYIDMEKNKPENLRTITTLQALDELVDKSKRDWEEIKRIMNKEDIPQEIAVYKYMQNGNGSPQSFSESDRQLFHELELEMSQQGILENDQNADSINQIIAFTQKEKSISVDVNTSNYYSPVEQSVYDELIGSEMVKLREEANRMRARGSQEFQKNGIYSQQKENEWMLRQENKRKNYVHMAITSARQHMYLSSHIQLINASFGNLPESGTGQLQAYVFEKMLRAFNLKFFMHERYKNYDQPVVSEMSSLTYLMFFREHFGKELRLSGQKEWIDLLENAVSGKSNDNNNEPKEAQEGFKDVIKYLQDELGLPYDMMFTSQMLPSGGVYDPHAGWRDILGNKQMVESVLEVTGKLGAIDDLNRFEYSLGMQFDLAGDINDDEVLRSANRFKTMKLLLSQMERERGLVSDKRKRSSQKADSAYQYLQSRLSDKDMIEIQTMTDLIEKHEQALEGNDREKIVQTARAVQERYESESFENLNVEMTVQRKKHILRKMGERLPSFIAQFLPEETHKIMVGNMLKNDTIRKEIGIFSDIGDIVDAEKLAIFNGKTEKIWKGIEHAIYAVQNDLVRHKVTNRNVDEYFGREDMVVANLDTYLKQFLGEDYDAFSDTGHEIVNDIRKVFLDMEQGHVGRAQKLFQEGAIDDQDKLYVGMAQMEKIARFARPFSLMFARSWEESSISDAGGFTVIDRRNGEIAAMASATNMLDGLLTGIHRTEPAEAIGKIDELVKIVAGIHGADKGILSGKSVLEAHLEMVKAPDLLEKIPGAERLIRMFVGSDNIAFREYMRKRGSRLMRVTRDPNAPIFQKNELRQYVDLAWQVDAFLQQPEVFDELYEELKIRNKDLRKYQFRKILPYIVLAIGALLIIQGWTVLQQGEEER